MTETTAPPTSSVVEDAFGRLLDTLYFGGLDKHDRGDKFERLIRSYLMTDPAYTSQFDEVWAWNDYPGRDGRTDDGVDLVARDAITGDLTAIQCKFIDPQTTVGKPQIDSFVSASSTGEFARRIFVSTTTRMNSTIEEYMQRLDPPLTHLNVYDLADAPIDWTQFSLDRPEDIRRSDDQKSPMPHQRTAMNAVADGFTSHDRGKLIMACGTGKTYTSLQIMEQQTGPRDTVLFLVPSIALLSQTLTEWKRDAKAPFRAFAVCSDVKVGKNVDADVSTTDLIIPATTDSDRLIEEWRRGDGYEGRTVIFSTYQSTDVLTGAQRAGLPDFDLIICDEAHRTTGATAAGQEGSNFVRVHDDAYVRASKRLYMTATPRVFDESSKRKAEENSVVVASMDDEALFGPEFHHLGFGQAVEAGLLTDYKVLILTVDEGSVNEHLQKLLTDEDGALRLDEAAQMVGVWKGLATRGAAAAAAEAALASQPPAASLTAESGDQGSAQAQRDAAVAQAVAEARRTTPPMRRAVAFASNIKESQRIARSLEIVGAEMGGENGLQLATRHVDGGMNVAERTKHLGWLEETPPAVSEAAGECRILTNARCLSEGVDVPSLDAVLFLSPRNSQVDVVQSVGRVMRRSKGKDFGYIILPVAVPAGATPEEALKDNKKYKAIWSVLNALRSHDDRFDAMVNQLDLNKHTAGKVVHEHVEVERDDVESAGATADGDGSTRGADVGTQVSLYLEGLDQWREALYAKIVQKVGDREYWDKWQDTIADVAARQVQRLHALVLDGPDPQVADQFREFVSALRANLNDGITDADAVSMLAQHLITKPVFDALFSGYDFAEQNPVSRVMGRMVTVLEGRNLGAETEELEGFYASVRRRAEGIESARGKQQIITELYEGFFTKAFPKQADALGIVYTPVEVVDFILRGVDDLLREHFGKGITDEGVHLLDPFTGTGTFIVRLLESGLIDPHDLARKYAGELHANEIMLLAYYIAAVNIEATFHGIVGGQYEPFGGIVLADTFQMTEDGDTLDDGVFIGNSDRAKRQLDTDIRVIVGNPPYSVGQTSANDNNANQGYPTLDDRIRDTYAAEAAGQNKNSLYDSYVRAMRWGTDRLGDAGVLAYVTNGGYIDANSAAGIRAHLARDFDHLYVYNLRGNANGAGEARKKEAGNVFGAGTRTTIAVMVGVKDPAHRGPCELWYRDIGDYLNRDEKLAVVGEGTIASTDWAPLISNSRHEWINQSSDVFDTFAPLGDKSVSKDSDVLPILTSYSRGLETSRDAWVYGYSSTALRQNVAVMTENYEAARQEFAEYAVTALSTERSLTEKHVTQWLRENPQWSNPTRISWSRSLRHLAAKNRRLIASSVAERPSVYRPFARSHVYFASGYNHERSQLPRLFPTAEHTNFGIYIVGSGSAVPYTAIATDLVPDLHVTGAGSGGQFFSRYTYEPVGDAELALGTTDEPVIDGYRRVDNVSDDALHRYRKAFGGQVTKDEIFASIYALLHSEQYRSAFAADLKRQLPRVPLPVRADDFYAFERAGRELLELHIDYENAQRYSLDEEWSLAADPTAASATEVTKMRWGGTARAKDRTRIVVNDQLTLVGIPDEAHEYVLGSRSALDWVLRQYQVTTDKASGIVNDPNDWGRESNNPRYIVDLVEKVTTVSVETMRIVRGLPQLTLE